jgi:hypothetical protein
MIHLEEWKQINDQLPKKLSSQAQKMFFSTSINNLKKYADFNKTHALELLNISIDVLQVMCIRKN